MDTQDDKCRGNPTSQPRSHSTTTLPNCFAAALKLTDPWHLAHLEGREYCFYSPPTTLSRIDYLLCNSALFTKMSDSYMTLPYPTMPQYPYHYETSALHKNLAFPPNSLLETLIFRKPCMRQTTLWPMLRTVQIQTCSGMQAKSSYKVGLLPSPPYTNERSLQAFRKPVTVSDMPRLSYPLTIPPTHTPWDLAQGQKRTSINGWKVKKAYINHILSYNTISLVTNQGNY